jgi:hypothetical protein
MLKRIGMVVQATTVTGIVWNAWKHSWIVLIISGDVCTECPLGFQHVLTLVALQTVVGSATPIFEGGHGGGNSTAGFRILNEDEVLIWELEQCPFCCHPLSPVSKPASLTTRYWGNVS